MLFILLVPVVVEVVIACCDCPDPVYAAYSNKSVSVDHLDNGGDFPVSANSGPVSRRAYGVRVRIQRETVAYGGKELSSFFQSAIAFDCYCDEGDELVAKDSLTGFRITTLGDIDAEHPANSDVSDYFKVYTSDSHFFQTIDSYFDFKNTRLYERGDLVWTVDLLLMTFPEHGGMYQFKIQLPLSDGRVLEGETTSIELTE
jgi:hypothetical protein